MKERIGVLFLIASLLFFACSKEKSLEDPVPGPTLSSWSFKDSAGTPAGNFDTVYVDSQGSQSALSLEGTSSDGQNHLFLQVIADPLSVGTYTDDQVSFGYFQLNNLVYINQNFDGGFSITITKLDGQVVEGTFAGKIIDSTGNVHTITEGRFTAGLAGNQADGDIICSTIGANGIFTEAVQLDASSNVSFAVNVTKPGKYIITTASENGFLFSGEGEFADTGTQTISLIGIGTPLVAGNTDFSVSFGQSVCNFTVAVAGSSDSLINGVKGTLASEEKHLGGNVVEGMLYYSGNNKIGQIASDANPMRKVFYNGQNNIERVELYTPDGLGGFNLGATLKYTYVNGNVTSIDQVDGSGNVIASVQKFAYNPDSTLDSKTNFVSGSPVAKYTYQYNGGNLVKINAYDGSGATLVDSISVEYDSTRINNFSKIHSQYYFLDMATVFESSQTNEIFYFSKNYPVKLTKGDGAHIIQVNINPNLIPIEILFDGNVWYKYIYN